jgi:hypothetical protein
MVGMSFFGWVAERFGSIASVVGIGGAMFLLAWGNAWFSRQIHLQEQNQK